MYKPFFPFAQHVRTFTVSLRRGVDHLDQPFRVVLGSYDQGGSLVMDNGGTNRRLRVGLHETVVRKSILERIRRVSRTQAETTGR